jgi:hypothetical protein
MGGWGGRLRDFLVRRKTLMLGVVVALVVGTVQLFVNDGYERAKEYFAGPNIEKTEVIYYSAVRDDRLVSSVRITHTVKGSCDVTSSLMQSDAVRCFTGHEMHEACWSRRSSDRAGHMSFVCVSDPWAEGALEILVPQGKLESVASDEEEAVADPSDIEADRQPWALEVQDPDNGERFYRCLAVHGTLNTVGGLPIRYMCWLGKVGGVRSDAYGARIEKGDGDLWLLPVSPGRSGPEVTMARVRKAYW